WNYLPLTPLAVESLDLSDADIIVSSSHAFAKGVLTTARTVALSYIHSPMRYAWDLHFQYLRDYGLDTGIKGHLARWMFHRLRLWDRQTANNVDLFLANSDHVRQRIWRTYRRPARVLYPPVKVEKFGLQREKDDYYVSVSRLVSYKRMELIVDAFARDAQAQTGGDRRRAGTGQLQAHCPANVTLMGWQPDDVVRQHMAAARAFVFAAHEDFGISPVEAQACGTPVIAYGAGGSV
ncbi:MAG: glycosyltransferase, partial [Comamonadaceae bacterium]|nr:glycosyltransferase [Comamonadaceae bacterium]